jgi:glycosyltransferase involved in cell wall biosynthesis
VREAGLKVYYQPASKVTHFEGISSGTDLTKGMKKYQVVNQVKFKEKWAKVLPKHPHPGSDIEFCRINQKPKRILIYDACTPTPDQDAGSLRMINIIKVLINKNYHVVFMPQNLTYFGKYTQALQQMGVECIYAPFYTNPIDYIKEKGSIFEHIILSRYHVAEQVIPYIDEYCKDAHITFDTVDLHHLREKRLAELRKDDQLSNTAKQTRLHELAAAKACNTTLVVSPYEVQVLKKEVPDINVKVVTTIHELHGCRKNFKQRKDIMFIGGYEHPPNVDAVLWFIEEMLPAIVEQIPDIKFHIIGSKAPQCIKEIDNEHCIYHGFVEDIEPFLDNVRLAVAPLRYGAGVKGKINSSMSYGQPVVGTKLSVEGMHTEENINILTADTAKKFAKQVLRLYQDEQLWNQISKAGLDNISNHFSFEVAQKAINSVLNKEMNSLVWSENQAIEI